MIRPSEHRNRYCIFAERHSEGTSSLQGSPRHHPRHQPCTTHPPIDEPIETPGPLRSHHDRPRGERNASNRWPIASKPSSFLLLVVRHLLLVAWHLFLIASCYSSNAFLLLVVRPGAPFVASDRSVRSDALTTPFEANIAIASNTSPRQRTLSTSRHFLWRDMREAGEMG